MKTILFVVENLSGGGAEKVLLTLVKNLSKKKYNITVYTIVNTGVYVEEIQKYCTVKYALKDYNEYSIVGKFYYKIKYQMIYKLNTSLVYKCLIKDKFDIEIAFVEGFDTKFVSASTNKNSKKYAWVHTDMNINNSADEVYHNFVEHRDVYKQYNKIIAVSNSVKQSFENKFNIHNVFVQLNPVDENDIIEKSKEFAVKKNKDLQLISIGRLVTQKGYDRLLKVLLKLKNQNYANFNVWILGCGEKEIEYNNFIKENGLEDFIKILGFKKNPYPYILASDAFICCSRAEGFNTAATESLILEKPIFTVNCSGMSELFGQFECGIIVENSDEQLELLLKKILIDVNYEKYKKNIKIRKKYLVLSRRIQEMERLLDE